MSQKSEWDIASDSAEVIWRAARAAGYDFKSGRELSTHSDMMELTEAIFAWLLSHMEKETT